MHPVERSSSPARESEVDPADLTARARIRNAALALFAERGFKGATVKQIAEAAGVSHGLLQHHFGSKDDLRQACDAYVLRTLGDLDSLGAVHGEFTDPDFMAGLMNHGRAVLPYVARAMAEGEPIARALFERGAGIGEEWLAAHWPDRFVPGASRTRDAAAVMAAMHLSTIVMYRLLSERMGVDTLGPDGAGRIPRAMFDLYGAMGEFVASAEGAGVRAAVDTAAGKEDGDG
ncbi:TetR/AcrR family transcriptional regulator [Myceligenerans pegani]|uniref:TetR/AcrR family transcriptional regulator n=1 Tax=Myceligenerans pegani TaxID=2776917 RepID=A0ABR9MW93_9MICO|nr:TetR/AcrR family transcriptional regulator [Myceligenerans sp. TRM 65318]MBE1875655.1 TetR/AcrR family transcriptional regulator [Myceligenerans sp. TRM 65318]MBE3017926.1 TetR/AcrR family transcriptional regulator [Myceligenerans sp. TRM 65318]